MYKPHKLGQTGEDLACYYLSNLGYEIIQRNFRYRKGEIDIIAKDKDEVVFIEVKTRSSGDYGEPAEAVTARKKKHIFRTAQLFLKINNIEDAYTRFDVIEIYFYKNKYYIHHIKQII